MSYWDDCIELIKTHSVPYENNNPNDITQYEYINGCLKTQYITNWKKAPLIKEIYDKYVENFNVYDPQIFATLGKSNGIGEHDDFDNVIILVLEGNMSYKIKDKMINMNKNESIYIPAYKKHTPFSNSEPRICLSMGTPLDLKKTDVTYHYNYI